LAHVLPVISVQAELIYQTTQPIYALLVIIASLGLPPLSDANPERLTLLLEEIVLQTVQTVQLDNTVHLMLVLTALLDSTVLLNQQSLLPV